MEAVLSSGMVRELAARYEKGSDAIEIFERSGKLFIEPLGGGPRSELRSEPTARS